MTRAQMVESGKETAALKQTTELRDEEEVESGKERAALEKTTEAEEMEIWLTAYG